MDTKNSVSLDFKRCEIKQRKKKKKIIMIRRHKIGLTIIFSNAISISIFIKKKYFEVWHKELYS